MNLLSVCSVYILTDNSRRGNDYGGDNGSQNASGEVGNNQVDGSRRQYDNTEEGRRGGGEGEISEGGGRRRSNRRR